MTTATKRVRCNVRCNECGSCYTHTLYGLRDIIISIDLELADWAKNLTQRVKWGYAPDCISKALVSRLIKLKRGIDRYYHLMREGVMGCLCNDEFQRMKEQVAQILDLRRCKREKVTDIRIDYSGYDLWVMTNPNCVAYDAWEKGLVACQKPTFIISAIKEEERAKRVLHALVSRIDSGGEVAKCFVELLATAYHAKCEATVTASATNEKKCKAELKALVKNHKCTLTFTEYAKLLECNLTFKIIGDISDCGGKFTFNQDGTAMVNVGTRATKCVDLVTLAGGSWPEDLNESLFQEMYG